MIEKRPPPSVANIWHQFVVTTFFICRQHNLKKGIIFIETFQHTACPRYRDVNFILTKRPRSSEMNAAASSHKGWSAPSSLQQQS